MRDVTQTAAKCQNQAVLVLVFGNGNVLGREPDHNAIGAGRVVGQFIHSFSHDVGHAARHPWVKFTVPIHRRLSDREHSPRVHAVDSQTLDILGIAVKVGLWACIGLWP
jgi:hypothetical protein